MIRLSALFLTTALLLGCGTSLGDGADGGAGGAGGAGGGPSLDENGCPIDEPSDGASCDIDQKVCEYWNFQTGQFECNEKKDALRCEDGEWTLYDWYCHCPEALPEAGTDCIGYHATITGCVYVANAECGETQAYSNCGSQTDYLWEVSVDETCPDL